MEQPFEELAELEAELQYHFLDRELLARALTHSSCKNDLSYCNERLEFLGDAVLGMMVTEYLFQAFPDDPEGELTRIKSVVVSRTALAGVALELRLADFLILGKGLADRERLPKSMLANAFEAILAAIYLDGGAEQARRLVLRMLERQIDLTLVEPHSSNFKSRLQHYAQREMGATPTYRVSDEQGPEHVKSFTVVAVLNGKDYGVGSGRSKKEAEQEAARESLSMLDVPRPGKREAQG